MNKLAAATIALLFSTLCLANMTLLPDSSQLSFTSTKQDTIAEVHHIKKLSGSIRDDVVQIILDLTSVDTKIAIRDQRIRDHLFETSQFASATYTNQTF